MKKEYGSKLKVIKHTKNRGVSASINTGVRATRGHLLLILNNDVLPSVGLLETVLAKFEDSKVFSVSLHEKGFGPARGYFADGFILIGQKPESNRVEKSFYASGGSAVIRKRMWQELGGMDEKLLSPFYWEDIDLCFRASKRGYLNLWDPENYIVHNHESTVSKFPKKYVQRIRERNQLLTIWKNIHSKSLFKKHISGLISRCLKHPGYLRIILMASFKLPLAIKARRKEQKESTVSDEAVFSTYS